MEIDMKKYIVFLSIVVFVGFSITTLSLVNLHKHLKYEEARHEADDREWFKLDDLRDVTKALLKMEESVFKNNYDFYWNHSDEQTGYAHMAIAEAIENQLLGYSSYSCDTHMRFITPVCEVALAKNLRKSELINKYFDWHNDDYDRKSLIKNKFINKYVSESWYRILLDQDPEMHKKYNISCKYGDWKKENEEKELYCAKELVHEYWPLERVLKEVKETPITDYLKRNENIYSKLLRKE